MSHKYDVIISGAGPSGNLLAYLLASNDIKTLVLEKKLFPRLKICAGGLQYRAAQLLPFDISPVVEKTIYGIYFSYRAQNIVNRIFDDPLIYMVDRKIFDQFLAQKAQEKGARYRYKCPVTGYKTHNYGVTVDTPEASFEGKVLVGADGIRGLVHRTLISSGQLFKIIGYEFQLGREGLNKILDLDNNASIDFGGIRKGYAWIFPKKDYLSVGIGGPYQNAAYIKEYFKKFLSGYALFKGVDTVFKLYGQCIPVKKSSAPVSKYRILAVGDAAGLGDAFTGEGLYNGFRSALLAYHSIKSALDAGSYDFNHYSQEIGDSLYEDIRISMLFSRLFFLFPYLIYNILKKNDKMFKTCCQVLRGEKSYQQLARKIRFLRY